MIFSIDITPAVFGSLTSLFREYPSSDYLSFEKDIAAYFVSLRLFDI